LSSRVRRYIWYSGPPRTREKSSAAVGFEEPAFMRLASFLRVRSEKAWDQSGTDSNDQLDHFPHLTGFHKRWNHAERGPMFILTADVVKPAFPWIGGQPAYLPATLGRRPPCNRLQLARECFRSLIRNRRSGNSKTS